MNSLSNSARFKALIVILLLGWIIWETDEGFLKGEPNFADWSYGEDFNFTPKGKFVWPKNIRKVTVAKARHKHIPPEYNATTFNINRGKWQILFVGPDRMRIRLNGKYDYLNNDLRNPLTYLRMFIDENNLADDVEINYMNIARIPPYYRAQKDAFYGCDGNSPGKPVCNHLSLDNYIHAHYSHPDYRDYLKELWEQRDIERYSFPLEETRVNPTAYHVYLINPVGERVVGGPMYFKDGFIGNPPANRIASLLARALKLNPENLTLPRYLPHLWATIDDLFVPVTSFYRDGGEEAREGFGRLVGTAILSSKNQLNYWYITGKHIDTY
ncbi:MAG: hypothetical protein V3T17_09800 [Pseudomonadales bacterium]